MWGYNNNGQLGDGTNIDRIYPKDITQNFKLVQGEIIKKISLGGEHSIATTSQQRVFTWGSNTYGQLGDGTKKSQYLPVDITSHLSIDKSNIITDIQLGENHSCLVLDRQKVFLWGCNEEGQLGDNTKINRYKPGEITRFSDFVDYEEEKYIDLGYNHTMLRTNKNIYIWGHNLNFQLGDSTYNDRETPLKITDLLGSVENDCLDMKIAMGEIQTALLKTNGDIYVWGRKFSSSPKIANKIFNLVSDEAIDEISMGSEHASAITTNNRVLMWGYNAKGQIGDGTTSYRETSVDITLRLTRFELQTEDFIKKVSLGEQHSLLLTSKGRVFSWGCNEKGQLGQLRESKRLEPYPSELTFMSYRVVTELLLEENAKIDIPQPKLNGYSFSGWYTDSSYKSLLSTAVMPKRDLILYSKWEKINYIVMYVLNGGNNNPENPNTYNISSEIVLLEPEKKGHKFDGWYLSDTFKENPITIISDRCENITLHAKWISVAYDLSYMMLYEQFDIDTDIPLLENEIISKVSLGYSHFSILTSKERLLTWGNEVYGFLGEQTPSVLTFEINVERNFHLKKDDSIREISLGSTHSALLSSLGRVFFWGRNNFGQLGVNTQRNELFYPREISASFDLAEGDKIVKISLGQFSSSALSANGKVFMWGRNSEGQLGDGTKKSQYLPVDITSYFQLEDDIIVQIKSGRRHFAALTDKGKFFLWGDNYKGQLGNLTVKDSDKPTEITNYFKLDKNEVIADFSLGGVHSAALSSKGKLFLWGGNSLGEIGDGTEEDRLVPTEITDKFDLGQDGDRIKQVELGNNHSLALSLKGRVFTWGYIETILADKEEERILNLPRDITEEFDINEKGRISQIVAGYDHSVAVTSKGYMYMWGLFDGTTAENIQSENKSFLNCIIEPRFELVNNKQLENNESITPFIPLRKGYLADEWYVDSSMTTIFTDIKMPSNDLVLFSKWKKL